MKLRNLNWLTGLLFSILLISCSRSPSTVKSIPEDVTMAVSLNVYSLLEKSKTDISKMSAYKDIYREIKEGNRGFANKLNKFITKPEETGIDWSENLFIYPYNDYVVILGGVSNQDEFKKTFEDLVDELKGVDYDIDEEKEAGYEYLQMMQSSRYSDNPIIGWNSSTFMVIIPSGYMDEKERDEDLLETLEDLMTLESNESLAENENFHGFSKNLQDISFWMSYEFLEETGAASDIENEIDIDLSDTYYKMFAEFSKGEAVLTAKFDANEELKKELKENSVLRDGISKSLVKQLPKAPIFTTSFSMSPEGVKSYLRNMGLWRDMNDNFDGDFGIDLDDVLKSVDGDFVFSLSGLENKMVKYEEYDYYESDYVTRSVKTVVPNVVFLANINDDSKIKRLLRKVADDKKGDVYEIKNPYYPYFVTIKDQTLIITTDKNIIKGKYEKLSSGPIVSAATGSTFQANLNLDFKLANEAKYKLYEDLDFSMSDVRGIEVLMKEFSNIQFKVDEYGEAIMTLKTAKSDENALTTIINLMEDMADGKLNRDYSPAWAQQSSYYEEEAVEEAVEEATEEVYEGAEEVEEAVEEVDETIYYYALVDKLNIRSSPSLTASVVAQIKEGSYLEYLEEESSNYVTVTLRGDDYRGNFLKVRTSKGKIGWVHSATVNIY